MLEPPQPLEPIDQTMAIHDRGEHWHLCVEAAGRWADHVVGVIEEPDKVVRPREPAPTGTA